MMVCGRGSGRHILLWSLLLMSLLCWETVVNAQCTRFEFPTARNTDDTTEEPILETTENQSANITFNIDTHNCGDTAQVSVIISKMNQTTNFYEDFCKLQVNAGKVDAFYQEGRCRRGESEGSYILSKRVDRSDDTLWRWRASYKEQRSQQTVRMLVRHPPRITQLSKSFPSAAAKPGSSPRLVCNYERGNPDVSPSLKDAQGRELKVHQGPGEVTHTIRDVKCNDTGRFWCEAPRAMENKSLVLLVECPPQFREEAGIRKQFVVAPNKPAKLRFQIRSHTTNLSACWLSPWLDSGRSSPQASEKNQINCLSYVETSGHPPDMRLILNVPKMTSSNLGMWRLAIGNTAGSDDVIFGVELTVVHVPPGMVRTTVTPLDKTSFPTTRGPFFVIPSDDGEKGDEEEEESDSHILGIVIPTIVVIIIGGAALGICGFFLFRRFKGRVSSPCSIRRKRDVTEQPQEQENTYNQPVNSRTPLEGGERGSHCYQVLQTPSPLQDQENVYHQPANSQTLLEGGERGSHCYQVLETFSPPPSNNIYEEPKEPSSYSVPPPPRPAFSS